MTKDNAEKLNVLMLQMISMMNDSVAFVRDHDKENIFDYNHYKKTAGTVMGELFDIEEKIWKKYPELKPVHMDGEYDLDMSIYEPRFYTWDD